MIACVALELVSLGKARAVGIYVHCLPRSKTNSSFPGSALSLPPSCSNHSCARQRCPFLLTPLVPPLLPYQFLWHSIPYPSLDCGLTSLDLTNFTTLFPLLLALNSLPKLTKSFSKSCVENSLHNSQLDKPSSHMNLEIF